MGLMSEVIESTTMRTAMPNEESVLTLLGSVSCRSPYICTSVCGLYAILDHAQRTAKKAFFYHIIDNLRNDKYFLSFLTFLSYKMSIRPVFYKTD